MTSDDLARLADRLYLIYGRPDEEAEIDAIVAELRTLAQQQGNAGGVADGTFPPLPQTPFKGANGIDLFDCMHMHLYALTCHEAGAAHSPDAGVAVLRIPRTEKLDPIFCYFEDFEPGAGRITVACYGDAWTGAWGAMGQRTVRQFVAECDPGYLAGSFLQLCGGNKRHREYTTRVAAAVIAALAPQPKDAT